MRWPLRYQVLVPFLAAVFVNLTATSLVNAWLASRNARSELEVELRRVGRTFADAPLFPLEGTVLAHASDLAGAEFVVFERGGRQVAASRAEFSALPRRRFPAHVGPWKEAAWSEGVEIGGESYLHAAVLLDRRAHGGREFELHMLYPERAASASRRQAALPPLVVGMAAVMPLGLLAFAIALRVTRPVERLRRQVQEIADGHYEPLPLPARNDELRDLSAAVNELALRLVRYETEIRRSERMRTLGQLGGGIAHQMRNAATGCRMAIDLHRRECPRAGDEDLAVAARQLTLMEKHLQRFLTLGRPRTRTPRRVDLELVATGVAPLLMPSARHLGVSLELVVESRGLTAQGDFDDLEQALLNLAMNALEAAAAGPQPAAVRMVLKCERDLAVLEVADTGCGPPPGSEDLFDPFVSHKFDGTGLGLSVVQQIAAEHGGRASWRRVDEQTVFRIELPLAEAPAAAADSPPQAPPVHESPPHVPSQPALPGNMPPQSEPPLE